jgi:outer membrane protein OmpA-like peptidoglycan-associated protein
LDKLIAVLKSCADVTVEIEGHTDSEGTPERNQGLSDRRAKSVVDYLERNGVEAKKVTAVGYGETRPLVPNDTPENRAKNRRIEFTVKGK